MPHGGVFRFGPFRLDPRSRSLLRGDVVEALQPRLFDLLEAFVRRPGEMLTKDELIRIGWPKHEVSDNNLTQAISRLRFTLDADAPERYIQTIPRRGYRFVAPVDEADDGPTEAELDAMMAPHLALLDGRAMIETLQFDRIEAALALFRLRVEQDPTSALHRIGLANAYLLRYDSTRARAEPDVDALEHAVTHAREARRLAPALAEAWATYGFVIDRTGDRRSTLGALTQAVTLEPHHWTHHLRLAWCSWGEQRVRAARRTLELRRGLAAAHWLIATVLIARNDLASAEAELDAALTAMPPETGSGFSGAGIYWLKGLLCLARGADDEAMAYFERELALETRGHLYGPECCASAWYAKGVVSLRRGQIDEARHAFGEALRRVPRHGMARAAMIVLGSRTGAAGTDHSNAAMAQAVDGSPMTIDRAMAYAAWLDATGDTAAGVELVTAALAAAAPGNAGWLLPIDPLLDVRRRGPAWNEALTALHERTF